MGRARFFSTTVFQEQGDEVEGINFEKEQITNDNILF